MEKIALLRVKEHFLLFHRVHFLTFISFKMHEEAVLCECLFLDVSVTISRATSTLVYE